MPKQIDDGTTTYALYNLEGFLNLMLPDSQEEMSKIDIAHRGDHSASGVRAWCIYEHAFKNVCGLFPQRISIPKSAAAHLYLRKRRQVAWQVIFVAESSARRNSPLQTLFGFPHLALITVNRG